MCSGLVIDVPVICSDVWVPAVLRDSWRSSDQVIDRVSRRTRRGSELFLPHFPAFFRLRPFGLRARLVRIFLGSPRWPTVVGCRGFGGGDAVSETPKYSATLTRCFRVWRPGQTRRRLKSASEPQPPQPPQPPHLRS